MDGVTPRRRLVALLAALVVALALGAVAVRAATGGDPAAVAGPPAPAPQQPGPVLLLPGYGGSTTSLERLATKLRTATGRDVRVVRAVGDGTGDLTAQARALATVVNGLIEGRAPSVDLVGYSAGGVVARLWAADLGGGAPARGGGPPRGPPPG